MTLLLILIYIAFIALGIPDSLFGSSWPAIYTELGLNISVGGAISMLCSLCMIVSSLNASKLIKKFGTFKLTIMCTLLTALALIGYSISKNIYMLILFTIPLGLGAGSVDSALNNYVALRYSPRVMNFLHCSYGIGVSVSPIIMSSVLDKTNNWHVGYLLMGIVQAIIALLLLLTIPLSKKIEEKYQDSTEVNVIGLKEGLKIKGVIFSILIFMISCSIETTVGGWISTYLVNSKDVLVKDAAGYAGIYFIGFTLGRLISSIIVKKLGSKNMIFIGEGITLVATILLIINVSLTITLIGVFFIGFGIGPIYPNMTHLTPKMYSKENSQSIIGFQMAAASLGIMTIPFLYGILADVISPNIFPIYVFVLNIILAISIIALYKIKKERMN